jgi:hypothetical protein
MAVQLAASQEGLSSVSKKDYTKYGSIELRKHSLLKVTTDFIISFIIKIYNQIVLD